ncbi:DUF547 domain-containing protein [Alteromonas sp. McT4-15]|uniref:DUF547 domain-containing protein n=1 Tax=Alteromonas sp. McT4-15 TaxID=2881256 RepID=UPI001CF8B6F9|nr:DUF547 domain-containing protein [Alteromonas sp. McT4-15]MCB4436935.1 DUF547 domain-containing protein [Alteromonas sp. McT4-15]
MQRLVHKPRYSAFFATILTVFTATTINATPSSSTQFAQYTSSSNVEIQYPDVDAVLDISVIEMGASNRELAERPLGSTGTRLKKRVNRLTALESNRVYFENFNKQNYRKHLDDVTASLAELADKAPLKLFNKNEQLAYWLNLYNMTLLREMAYNQSDENIKYEFANERNSDFFNRDVLTIEGQALSLNDIKYDIVLNNFKGNENVIYGFFTGVIGGPSLQSKAFTGKNVLGQLKSIGREFVNSNRGTYYNGRVSALYARYSDFFDGENKPASIQAHILKYVEDDMRESIEQAAPSELNMDIVDFSKAAIIDDRVYAAGLSYNRAALMATHPVLTTGFDNLRFSLDDIQVLREINRKYNTARSAVTVNDLSESEASSTNK